VPSAGLRWVLRWDGQLGRGRHQERVAALTEHSGASGEDRTEDDPQQQPQQSVAHEHSARSGAGRGLRTAGRSSTITLIPSSSHVRRPRGPMLVALHVTAQPLRARPRFPCHPGRGSAVSGQCDGKGASVMASRAADASPSPACRVTAYVWGGGGARGPSGGGFDCSGLTQYAYHQVGLDLPASPTPSTPRRVRLRHLHHLLRHRQRRPPHHHRHLHRRPHQLPRQHRPHRHPHPLPNPAR